MTALPLAGRVVPRGWKLAVALLAGVFWVLALAVLSVVPADVRRAHLYRLATGEGVAWAGVLVEMVGSALLLTSAHRLSAVAHGNRSAAPYQVRVVRTATWLLFVLVVVGAVGGEAWGSRDCFRSCAPFPG